MKTLLFSSLIGIVFYGCSQPSGVQSNFPVRPGVGSYYVINSYNFDSSGVRIPATESSDTIRVVASGIAYRGKTNVVEYQWAASDSLNTFISFESNGDLSVYKDASPIGTWITFAVTTKQMTFANLDTTDTVNGQLTDYWCRDTCGYLKDSTFLIQGQSLSGVDFWVTQTYPTSDDDYVENDWFAPSIGFWASSRGGYANGPRGQQMKVIAYSIK